MSTQAAGNQPNLGAGAKGPSFSTAALATHPLVQKIAYPLIGIGSLLVLWWIGGHLIASNPDTASFADFGPATALDAFWRIISSSEVISMSLPSLERIGGGLFWAIILGVPMGIMIGRKPVVRSITHVPFQFLRMISPLSWMPIAVLVFASWDGAIVFLIAMAAVWPVTFATANGLRKVDPSWFKVARNLGAKGYQMLLYVIFPAIAMDILTGIRLDDVGLILEGAVPAALLALLVQGGFELAEKILVPKGMQRPSVV